MIQSHTKQPTASAWQTVPRQNYGTAEAQQARTLGQHKNAGKREKQDMNLTITAIAMRDKYTPVTVRRIDERSYSLNGYETDHSGGSYDAQDALDFIFKWYGTCTRHTITRP